MTATLTEPFSGKPWTEVDVPDDAARVPTMLTNEECQLLFWLARDCADGGGAVCDLGCFAGGSTARLAAGVAASGHQTDVHAFDHFLIQDVQKDRYLYPAGIAPFEGDDMLPAVRELLTPWDSRIQFHRGDIRQTGWSDGPIDLLFVDASKTPQTADVIAGVFMPHLIPGKSLVIQQDYQHWRQPWVPAQMELLADHFELVAWTLKGSVVFRCIKAPTPEIVAERLTSDLSDEAMRRALLAAIARFPDRPQRRRLACTVLALDDNPGLRLSYRFESKGFSADRVNGVLEAVGT